MNEKILRDTVFPILRRAMNLYRGYLTKDPVSGVYHLTPTYSPEYDLAAPGTTYPPGVTRDCNYDLALIHWGCRTLLAANARLGLNDTLASTWQDILDHLVTPPQDSDGLRIGADLPLAHGHRHYSHLLWFYPLYQLDPTTADGKTLLSASLERWVGFGSGAGYLLTGSASMYAALTNGNRALEQLNKLFTNNIVTKNTMYKEGNGPVIETPLSAAQSIHDMLVQSWGDTIRVFPAVPDAWGDVSVHNLRTEGAFLVSANRRSGTTRFIRVKSMAGEPCRIAPGGLATPYTVESLSGSVSWADNGDGTLTLSMPAGAEALIRPSSTVPDLTIAPVANPTAAYWGLPPTASTTIVDLSGLFSKRAIATAPGDANFDGYGYGYPAEQLPGSGLFISGGVKWTFPSAAAGASSALVPAGQTISVPAAKYQTVRVLGAGVSGNQLGTVTLGYSDGTTVPVPLNLSDWAASAAAYGESVAVYSTYRYGSTGINNLPVKIWHQTVPVDSARTLTSITLPSAAKMRIMAITMVS